MDGRQDLYDVFTQLFAHEQLNPHKDSDPITQTLEKPHISNQTSKQQKKKKTLQNKFEDLEHGC